MRRHCTEIVTIAMLYDVYVTQTRKSLLIIRLIVLLCRHVVAVEKRNGINHHHVRFLNVSGLKRFTGDEIQRPSAPVLRLRTELRL